MKIYNYDPINGTFLSEGEARKDPVEKDKYLVPANATIKEPLASKDGFAVCFVDGAWIYTVDNRNEIYYLNGVKVEFKLGEEISPDMSLNQFTSDELFQTAKDNKIALIDSTTGNNIELLVGDNNKQKDLLALANTLIRKESKGTISEDEVKELNSLEAINGQVYQLKLSGNAREAEVQALVLADFASLDEALIAVEAI